jgi:hypothetical protein
MITSNEEQALNAAPRSDAQEPKLPKKPHVAKQKAHVAPVKGKTAKKATATKKSPKGAKAAKPAKAAGGAREGSKTAIVVGLLERKDGATLAEVMRATNWQAHSVRGFISGTLGKKMGRTVKSSKREDGERVYQIKA